MVDHFGNPQDMHGYWPEFYNKLVSMPTCEFCTRADLEKEALAICNAVWTAMDTLSGIHGCIYTALHVYGSLAAIPGVTITGKDVNGASVFGRTDKRYAWEITTKCFVMQNVARWRGFFRHEAVLVMPRCAPDYSRPDNVIIDLWWFRGGIVTPTPFFESYESWAGGKDRIGKYSGPVSAGF